MNVVKILILGLLFTFGSFALTNEVPSKEIIKFKNGALSLCGAIYKPQGTGSFPAILYNHGDAQGMLNDQVRDRLGPNICETRLGVLHALPPRTGV